MRAQQRPRCAVRSLLLWAAQSMRPIALFWLASVARALKRSGALFDLNLAPGCSGTLTCIFSCRSA